MRLAAQQAIFRDYRWLAQACRGCRAAEASRRHHLARISNISGRARRKGMAIV